MYDIEQTFPAKTSHSQLLLILKLCLRITGSQKVFGTKNYLRTFTREIHRKIFTRLFDSDVNGIEGQLVLLESNLRVISYCGLKEEVLEQKHDMTSRNMLADSVKYLNLSSFYMQNYKFDVGAHCAKRSLRLLEAKVIQRAN